MLTLVCGDKEPKMAHSKRSVHATYRPGRYLCEITCQEDKNNAMCLANRVLNQRHIHRSLVKLMAFTICCPSAS